MDPKTELRNYIVAKIAEGILGDDFVQMRGLQRGDNPYFVVEAIKQFTTDADEIVYKCLPKALALPGKSKSKFVNFGHVYDHSYKLKSSSSCIGGVKVAKIAGEMIEGTRPGRPDKESCLQAYAMLQVEYEKLRDCLKEIAEMERKLIEN